MDKDGKRLMDAAFWHNKWAQKDIAFHELQPNPLLVRWLETLPVQPGDRIFVPLCGKSRDIAWLLSKGYRVAGAELSPLAIEALFDELALTPTVTAAGKLTRFSATNLDIFVGDILDLSPSQLGEVDALYDRAALVALPEVMRDQYARQLVKLTDRASQLVICFEYDQQQLAGPPFAINHDELARLYRQDYDITSLQIKEVAGGLKGTCAALEHVWRLSAKRA